MSPVFRDFFYYCIIFVMIDKKYTVELLAPAKNKECAIAAINAGADAVYIGAQSFGARKKAGNSLEDIAQVVDYAHKFLVKIYVTVNTILYDNELADVEKLIWDLYEIGVDAIIFQDFSFFKMHLPPVVLHASTQCNNDSLEKIKFLKSVNVDRVVLPREFSISEIKNVADNIDIETEVFVHGALCVSYSGQCYFSNFIGNRSANRGDCAQPCRKKYTVIDENNNIVIPCGYLLSMKDNNLSAHINELIEAKVTSLKIEGRLKDKEYVTNVVLYYRRLIDAICANSRPSFGDILTDFVPDVNKTFNRGYTDFFIDGKRKIFINKNSPKFIGEKIGKVISVRGNSIQIDTTKNLNIADKVTFFDKNNELSGTTVTKLANKYIEVLNATGIAAGTVLYRNYDSNFYSSLNSAEIIRKIPLKIKVDNEKIILKTFGDNEITYKFNENFEKANNIEKARENVVRQLTKLGETEFYAADISVDSEFNLFIPVSKINEMRRQAVLLLQKKSKENYKFQRRDTSVKYSDYPINELDYSFNISNTESKAFYEGCGCKVKEFAPEISKQKNIILMKTKHCLRDFAGICLKKSKDNRKLFLVDESGRKFPLEFDCKNCIMQVLGSIRSI